MLTAYANIQLLRDLRQRSCPSRLRLGLPSLDAILDVFAEYNEKKCAPAVEITGLKPCSGKTQLLYSIVARALLPRNCGGQDRAVVLLDLEGQFDILCLHQILSQLGPAHDCLPHLHIFRPDSTPALLATLDFLQGYLLDQPSCHISSNKSLGLVALQDLSAFLYQDRAASEAGPPDQSNDNLVVMYHRRLVQQLQHLSQKFGCAIIATNMTFASPSHSSANAALRSHLPAVWNNFAQMKLVTERATTQKFAPGMSVQEAEVEREIRWQAVQRSHFTVWINWTDAQAWPDDLKQALRALPDGGSFTFDIADHIRIAE